MKLIKTFNFRLVSFVLVATLGVLVSSVSVAANLDSRIFDFQHKLANAGKYKAQFKLALMYEGGRGVAVDINKAKAWYKKSAAQGYKPAKHRIEYIGVKTKGFKVKNKPWLKNLIRDAKENDAEAMFLLAEMYERGLGVRKSLKNARLYYKKSTARGHADAEIKLYSIDQEINKIKFSEQAKKEKRAEKAKLAKAAKKAEKNQKTEKRKQQERQSKSTQKRKKQATKRAKLEKQKRNAEKKKRLAVNKKRKAEKMKASAAANQKEPEPEFESDLCSGAAARFRTQCN